MPSGYERDDRQGLRRLSRGHSRRNAPRRELLRHAMVKQAFPRQSDGNGGHFDYVDWKQYPILNTKFEDLGQ